LLLAAIVMASHVSRFDVGRLAVLLFFYLSGFWVTKVWVEKFGGRELGRFYAARYLRIVPLYLLVMVAAAWLRHMAIGLPNLTLFGVASIDQDPLGVSWSLDVEVQFYVLLPLLLPVLTASAQWTGVAALVAATLAWMISAATGVVTAFQYLPPFLLGILTYTADWRPARQTAEMSLGAFAAMTFATYFTTFMDKNVPDPFDRDLFALVWMLPLLPYVAHSLRLRSGTLDRHAGNLSFPLYLVHYPAITFVAAHGAIGLPGRLIGLAVSVGAALLLYFFIDRRLDAWRVRLTESGVPQPARTGP
jgi:peptidoglycan/LPS O-acetylase OafA/YrhL